MTTPDTRNDKSNCGKELKEFIESQEQSNSEPKKKIDVASLAIPQDFQEYATETKRAPVEARKPRKQEFFRIHSLEYQLRTRILRIQKSGDIYLVSKSLWEELDAELVEIEVFTAVSVDGDFFLWPVTIPAGDFDKWNRSALNAARIAQEKWVRLVANRVRGEYDVVVARNLDQAPEWPEDSFQDLIEQAFKNRYVDSTSHPVIRKLTGEIG